MRYNHAITVSFTIDSDSEADDLTSEEIGDRLVRILNHSDLLAELIETAEIYDTVENDDE